MNNLPKIKKEKKIKEERIKNLEIRKKKVKSTMFSSTLITYGLAAIFLVISFIFNGSLISGWVQKVVEANNVIDEEGPSFIYIMDIIIKSFSVILFFFFNFISVGNIQEFRGYIMTWKEMLVLIIISLLQVSSNFTTFFIATIGITICIIYFYFLQGKIEKMEF
jgi:hypothetical protein